MVRAEELKYDERGLIPCIVQDAATGEVLTLAWQSREALERTLRSGQATFWSRSRGEIWVKGATSGNTQAVRAVRTDCDHDAVLLRVAPVGPACHTGARSCFFEAVEGAPEAPGAPGETLARLEQVLKPGNPLLLKVRVQVEEAGTRLSLQEARRLDELPERAAADEFRVRLEMQALSEEILDRLEDVLASSPGPCPVVFEMCSPDGCVAVLQAKQRVKSTPELAETVRQICGARSVVTVAE